MPAETILVVDDAREMRDIIAAYILRPQGYQVFTAENATAGLQLFRNIKPDLIISDINMPDMTGLELTRLVLAEKPSLPVILITAEGSESVARQVMQVGALDYMVKPVDPQELLDAVERCLRKAQTPTPPPLSEATSELRRRLDELETLTSIVHNVTSILDLDAVLTKVVDAAVSLTEAEEGSLLLLDERTHELVMRASKNFEDSFARAFRLKTDDSLAGQVIRTGQPVLMDQSSPQKIKTFYLVHTLLYVPLKIHGRVIGVLGVDNRMPNRRAFGDHDLSLLQALSDYAAIAIENARLYLKSETERAQLETIFSGTEDGVVVVDEQAQVVLMNPTARVALNLQTTEVLGQSLATLVERPEITKLLAGRSRLSEIPLSDGRIFNAHLTPIPGLGRVIFMQDITHLKELDRIKSDFVSTVSHDLRSPLTAILGYVELITRTGSVNDLQREFLERIQQSVQSINSLVTDLLDLGRIEGGFDTQREPTSVEAVLRVVMEELKPKADFSQQLLDIEIKPNLAPVLANAPRLRQMLNNLVDNALKYTPTGGVVQVRAYADTDSVVITIADSGIGIPLADQPYIFDKFFRASNARGNYDGTGLGLAIVKSIVDHLNGRIWVNSAPGAGSTFTVMMPTYQDKTKV